MLFNEYDGVITNMTRMFCYKNNLAYDIDDCLQDGKLKLFLAAKNKNINKKDSIGILSSEFRNLILMSLRKKTLTLKENSMKELIENQPSEVPIDIDRDNSFLSNEDNLALSTDLDDEETTDIIITLSKNKDFLDKINKIKDIENEIYLLNKKINTIPIAKRRFSKESTTRTSKNKEYNKLLKQIRKLILKYRNK